jgi:hypothetical protein
MAKMFVNFVYTSTCLYLSSIVCLSSKEFSLVTVHMLRVIRVRAKAKVRVRFRFVVF